MAGVFRDQQNYRENDTAAAAIATAVVSPKTRRSWCLEHDYLDPSTEEWSSWGHYFQQSEGSRPSAT